MVLIENEEYKELVIKANKYDELERNRAKVQERVCREQENKCGNYEANKENTTEEKTEKAEIKIKKVSAEEMAQLVDNLVNKILGGK